MIVICINSTCFAWGLNLILTLIWCLVLCEVKMATWFVDLPLKKWCFYTADMHITEDFHGEWDGDIMG